MKNLLLLLFSVFVTSVSFAQWQEQVSGTSEDLNDVVALDTSSAIAVGDNGIILKTVNNGLNWFKKNSGTIKNLNAVSFRNESDGIAVGDGAICRTSDGGETWSAIDYYDNFITLSYRDPYFRGPNILIGTDSGKVVYSGDDGDTWRDTVLFSNVPIITVGFNYFSPNLHAPLVFIATTSYRGTTFSPPYQWNLVENPINPVWDRLTGGEFYDESEYLIGEGGDPGIVPILIRVGTDTVIYSFVPPVFIPEDITSIGDILYVCGESGKLFKSKDSGNSWSEQSTETDNDLAAISFYDSLNGYSVGNAGIILHTTNGGVTSVEKQPQPNRYILYQNYPNPFNPATSIRYTINNSQLVTLKVFDMLGNEIATLVNEEKSAGEYKVEFEASNLPSGIYFYQLKAGNFIQTKKMILLR